MNQLSNADLLLIRRALILLSCVTNGKESRVCTKIADIFASEYRVRGMLKEDEQIEKEREEA